MNYRYFENKNYEDLASGRVIYNRSGFSNFPVRLAGEIYMNCLEVIDKLDSKAILYDPCCGSAYLLTVLGFLCGDHIDSIYASDISIDAIAIAKENLNLLTTQALIYRKIQLIKMFNDFKKESHAEAIKSADHLLEQIHSKNLSINCSVFSSDIIKEDSLSKENFKADIFCSLMSHSSISTILLTISTTSSITLFGTHSINSAFLTSKSSILA